MPSEGLRTRPGRRVRVLAADGQPLYRDAVVRAIRRLKDHPAEAERLGFVACGFARADAVPEAVDTGDDTADPSVQIVEKMSATKLRAKDRRAKEKALKEALERSYHGTEEDLETRRNKLKALIKQNDWNQVHLIARGNTVGSRVAAQTVSGNVSVRCDEGFLITAYPCDKIKEGDRIWPTLESSTIRSEKP